MKKIKILLSNVLLAAICFTNIINVNATADTNSDDTTNTAVVSDTADTSINYDLWPSGPNVSSESAILMDINTGTILYEKNINEQLYPASITKIMTTLLALENCSLDEIVTFSHNAVYSIERNSSHIGIVDDEQLTMEQCLYGIMLESANEVSNAVAEHVAGSIEEFTNLMNQKAVELGCLNTHFSNANGLPDETHYSSAYDFALIGRAAMQNETFKTITATPTYSIPPTNLQVETRYLSNHHKMLPNRSYGYADCIGGKTGYTNAARQTLVTFAKRGDLELVCVVMKTESPSQFTDTASLFDWGFENFQIINISENEKNYTIENACFYDTETSIFGNTNSIVTINKDGEIILPTTAAFSDTQSNLSYDASSDNSIGTLTYSYGGKNIGATTIDLSNLNASEFNFNSTNKTIDNQLTTGTSNKTTTLFSKTFFIIVVIVLLVLLILLFISFVLFKNYHFFRRKRIRKHRQMNRKFDDFDIK
jgi:serine-type D-Ala-D-Ala carboxypeptidase (penicillin-binding protein 5/6)